MSSENLAMIFGSLLVHNDEAPERMLVLHQNEAVQVMIDQYEEIFCSGESSCTDSEDSSRGKSSSKKKTKRFKICKLIELIRN